MTDIVLDTNCFVVLLDSSDKWNKTSVEIFSALNNFDVTIHLPDVVRNEAINVICKRLENKSRSSEISTYLKLIEKQYPAETIIWIS